MNDRTAFRPTSLVPEHVLQQAVALQNQGNLPAAEKIYRAILKQHPTHFLALYNLSGGLIDAERSAEAMPLLHKALSQAPKSAAVLTLIAKAHQNLGRDEEALEFAGRAIALDSGSIEAHAVVAWGLTVLGRYEEARSALARAMELAPARPGFYYQWGNLTRWTADDPRLAALEAMKEDSRSQSLLEQVQVRYALAKAHTDCGDIGRAVCEQIEGGTLYRKALGYDEPSTLGQMAALRGAFDAEWMRRHEGAGDPSPQPIFIVGMPRSGTTLVEQILASHPRVRALGERGFFEGAFARVCGTSATPPSPPVAKPWSGSTLRRLGALYLQAARRVARNAPARIVDKLPDNFRFAGLIHAALPNARIIHTCRDPVDTCLSIFSILFSGNAVAYSYDLGELGRYYRAYEKMMAHWRDALPAGTMLELRYEEIVDDLERQARRIIAYCGLDWDDACLAFHETNRPVRTASHAQVRQPIYRSSIGRQRPPNDLLHPLLQALGVG
jgi:tetratricopeptide (TPR) repeat protein